MMRFGPIGVPSSAGAHGPGQEKAPPALRNAGLLGALREAGLEVDDLGDLPLTQFAADHANRKQQNLCLSVFVGSPKPAALVVTEINPDNDPDGLLVRPFVDAFAEAMQPVAGNAARR